MILTDYEGRAIFIRESDGKAWDHTNETWIDQPGPGLWPADLMATPTERTDLRGWVYAVPPQVEAVGGRAFVYDSTAPRVEWGEQHNFDIPVRRPRITLR